MMMMRKRNGGLSTWSPQDWPCYYSERTDLMLPSLGGGWRRNAVSQSISSILTSRLISRPESRREKLAPRWNCTALHPKRMKISRDIIGRNKYLSCMCLTVSLFFCQEMHMVLTCWSDKGSNFEAPGIFFSWRISCDESIGWWENKNSGSQLVEQIISWSLMLEKQMQRLWIMICHDRHH